MNLTAILEKHKEYLAGEDGGVCANLRCANLRCADLRCADLRGADLVCANLTGADLTGADLRGANLTGAKQRLIHIKGSQHAIYAIDNDIRIGCQRHSLAEWLEIYPDLGVKNNYTLDQIREYGIYLKSIQEILKEP